MSPAASPPRRPPADRDRRHRHQSGELGHDAAPLDRADAVASGSRVLSGLLVFDHSPGGLGMLRVTDPMAGAPDSAGGLGVFLCARRDLEPAQLLLGQRRLLVGVVLAAGEHCLNRTASLRAVATIALRRPRRARAFGHQRRVAGRAGRGPRGIVSRQAAPVLEALRMDGKRPSGTTAGGRPRVSGLRRLAVGRSPIRRRERLRHREYQRRGVLLCVKREGNCHLAGRMRPT